MQQQTAEQRVARALELARQARDAGQITTDQYTQFTTEVGGVEATPATAVLINLELQIPAGTRLPQNGQLDSAVFDALNGAAQRVGASVVRDSVRVILSN